MYSKASGGSGSSSVSTRFFLISTGLTSSSGSSPNFFIITMPPMLKSLIDLYLAGSSREMTYNRGENSSEFCHTVLLQIDRLINAVTHSFGNPARECTRSCSFRIPYLFSLSNFLTKIFGAKLNVKFMLLSDISQHNTAIFQSHL